MYPIAITSTAMPHPVMAYSQAVKVGNLLFIAGQAGIDFKSGFISDDFETQARQAFDNLSMVLQAAGSSLANIAKTTIWLVDASNFECLNKLYTEYFPTNPPVRSTPIVSLPRKEFQISIEAIATVGE